MAAISIFVFSFLFLSATSVSAKVLSNQDGSVTVAAKEIINDDLFAGAKVVTIDGTVNGDVFAGAETINVDGVINGNLHLGAGTVNLSATVKGNVYVGAGTLNVTKSVIGGSLLVGSGDVNIDNDTKITGSLIAGAGNIKIDSSIRRSAYIGAGNATIGPNTKIGKDLYYGVENDTQLTIPATAVISGSIYKSAVKTPDVKNVEREVGSAVQSAKVFTLIGGLLSALLVGFLYLKFFENNFTGASGLVTEHFWKSLGVGFLVSILALPAFIILAITFVGIPLAGLLFLIFIIYSYMAKIIVGLSLGKWIVSRFNWTKISTFAAFAIGITVIYLLKIIPVVGAFAGLTVFLSGLGALSLIFVSKRS